MNGPLRSHPSTASTMVSSSQLVQAHSQPVPIQNNYAGVGGAEMGGGCHMIGTPEFSQVTKYFVKLFFYIFILYLF
jgi:hypothetical protein